MDTLTLGALGLADEAGEKVDKIKKWSNSAFLSSARMPGRVHQDLETGRWVQVWKWAPSSTAGLSHLDA